MVFLAVGEEVNKVFSHPHLQSFLSPSFVFSKSCSTSRLQLKDFTLDRRKRFIREIMHKVVMSLSDRKDLKMGCKTISARPVAFLAVA